MSEVPKNQLELETQADLVEGVEDASVTEDADAPQLTRYNISSYGADYTADGFVMRLSKGDIVIPEFQRGFVWTVAQASRFVESLILGLPVPGVFLFREPKGQKLMVVDGQQRLRSLAAFYEGVLLGKEFALRGVTAELDGKTYKTLDEPDRRRLNDAVIHATVFKQDDPQENQNSVYEIFERLNTGGTPLAPQEIRSCIYPGVFDRLLGGLAKDANWRALYGAPSKRGKDRELILRFFALYFDGDKYVRPMSEFLNEFMASNQNLERFDEVQLKDLFGKTVACAAKYMYKAVRPERNFNVALADALLVGLARRLKTPVDNPADLPGAFDALLKDEAFVNAYKKSTTDENNVKTRIAAAEKAFSTVK